jgi:hypothetical protein
MDLVEIDEGEHWRWLGSLNGSGYGNFWFEGSVVRAHIWAFEEWVRAIDDDESLRPHEGCDGERPCVNPNHHIVRERGSSQFPGIARHADGWYAKATVGGVTTGLGYFKDEQQAMYAHRDFVDFGIKPAPAMTPPPRLDAR